jgi:nucleoid-associated protein YgaU
MAKETKVGLLVGLAFIVCFAVILANRGRDQFIPAQIPGYLVHKPTADPATRTPDSNPGPRTTTTYDSNGRAIVHATPGRDEPPLLGGPRPESDFLSAEAARNARGMMAPDAREPERGSVSPDNRSPNAQELQQMLDRIAATINAQRAAGGATTPNPTPQYPQGDKPIIRPADPPTQPKADGRAYVVQRGDSLSKIAQATYGSQSRSVIDRIYAANRATMSSPNDLKAGATIILPEAPKAEAANVDVRTPAKPAEAVVRNEPRTPDTRPAAEPEKKTLSAAKRWYVVRENDRFASIAREQLGDESRWREIHELNKDKFPDPNKIRPGVRIQIPAGTVVSSRE